jgi:hypothetical protein
MAVPRGATLPGTTRLTYIQGQYSAINFLYDRNEQMKGGEGKLTRGVLYFNLISFKRRVLR